MRYHSRRRRVAIEAIAVAPLQAQVQIGALSVPPWLLEPLRRGRVRIRPDVVEIMQPTGLVTVAGPNDLLVHDRGEVFPMRSEWFFRLFQAVGDTT